MASGCVCEPVVDSLCSSAAEPRVGNSCLSELPRYRFTRRDRVRKSAEFGVVMRRGTTRQTPHFKIRALPNTFGCVRLGLVVGKRAGNACVRNLIKRRLREYFRLNRQLLPPNMDLVIIAKTGAGSLESEALIQELNSVFT